MKQQDAKIMTIRRRKRTWVYGTMRPRMEIRQRKWMEERILGSETTICGLQREMFIGSRDKIAEAESVKAPRLREAETGKEFATQSPQI